MRTLVIIPAFNEEDNIEGVLRDLAENFSGADVIVVDDGSTDGTAERASRAGVKVIPLLYNLGVGSAMQTGYMYAENHGYDIAIQFDGDGQHIASEIPHLVDALSQSGADAAVGSRFLSSGKYSQHWARALGIKVLSSFISRIIGQDITDPTSGFRAINRRAIAFLSMNYPEDYPEAEAIVLMHKAGLGITEVPVDMRPRQGGASSITTGRGIYYMIKVILAIMVDMIKQVKGVA